MSRWRQTIMDTVSMSVVMCGMEKEHSREGTGVGSRDWDFK